MVKVRGWEFGVRADESIIVRKYVDERGSGNVQAFEVFSRDEFQTVMRGLQAELDVFDEAKGEGIAFTDAAEVNDARNALGARQRGLEAEAAKAKAEADAADAAAAAADVEKARADAAAAALAAAAVAKVTTVPPIVLPALPAEVVVTIPAETVPVDLTVTQTGAVGAPIVTPVLDGTVSPLPSNVIPLPVT